MSDKIFCGSGKAIQTQYGELLKLSLGEKDLQTLMDNKNEKGWVNIVVNKRKEVGKYGDTHSLVIDNWKPESKGVTKEEAQKTFGYSRVDISDVPW